MLRTVLSALLIFLVISSSACSGSDPGQGQNRQQGGYTASAGEEDLSAKVDKTIKVLSVIRDELDKMKESEKAQPASAASSADSEWVDSMRGKLSAVIRMWKKTDQIMNPAGTSAPGQAKAAQGPTPDTVTAELNAKIDSAIKAMEVIKQELDEVDKEIGTKEAGKK